MFLNDDFLLTTDVAKTLFHDYAKKQPIVDYHCHLSPQEIYEDKNFSTITEAWLYGDHYKWRLMRANGIDESLITGNGSDYDKFMAWAKTLPHAIGNPLYAWTHLELKRFFGIDTILNEETADAIWHEANTKLLEKKMSRRNLIRNSNVKVICTTDDPIDDLHYHELIAQDENEFRVLPTFRPDKALNIHHDSFNTWLKALEAVVGYSIDTHQKLLDALEQRVSFFHEMQCRLSDHALDTVYFAKSDTQTLDAILIKARTGESISTDDVAQHMTSVLLHLFKCYHDRKWTMQLHMHAFRNVNTAQLKKLGPDTGYDGINDALLMKPLSSLLDAAEQNDALPRTILYSLNSKDYDVLLAMMASFQKDSVMKIQLGSGWWFNDTRSGMRKQISSLAEHSLLGHFVGMLTDSRSFLSYTRHEYFRRVLCELVGEWVDRGELPDDMSVLGSIINKIAYTNANELFQ
ncbi:glucuronate isomerase [Erysipelothrix sp. HDW6C]|uniref:glucuronate isomerase n=1 Tax=Erysipelothrix sp. HDW6C TaxID=2714930 RepID=UPI0014094AF6|nr:glucuronate isomerase [Erysipelothrix sp. HDW6C]QIK69301.1 glucuronate isomerase [Erysipelothrix sp. HDW6C]